jgi:hypothetical protein
MDRHITLEHRHDNTAKFDKTLYKEITKDIKGIEAVKNLHINSFG